MPDFLLPTTIFSNNAEKCTYCGKSIGGNRMGGYDDVLDSWYCDTHCRNLHLKAEPNLLKLYKEDSEE